MNSVLIGSNTIIRIHLKKVIPDSDVGYYCPIIFSDDDHSVPNANTLPKFKVPEILARILGVWRQVGDIGRRKPYQGLLHFST